MKYRSTRRENVFPIFTNNEYTRVNVEDIQFIEQTGRKMHVVTASNKEYEFYGRLEEIAHLLVGKNFYRPLKTLVINFDMVESISRQEICFMSGINYAVGRNNMIKTRRAFKNYILGVAPFGESILGVESGLLLAEETVEDSFEKNEE